MAQVYGEELFLTYPPPLSSSPILDCGCLKAVIIGEGGLASLGREVLRLDLRILPFYLLLPMGLWLQLPIEDSCLLFCCTRQS